MSQQISPDDLRQLGKLAAKAAELVKAVEQVDETPPASELLLAAIAVRLTTLAEAVEHETATVQALVRSVIAAA